MMLDPDSLSTSEPSPSRPDPAAPSSPSDNAADPLEPGKGKKRFKKGIGNTETDEEEKPDQAIELVNSLLQDLIAKKEQRVAPEVETRTAKYHRLAKSARPAGGGTAAPPEAATADAAAPDSAPAPQIPSAPVPPPPGYRPAEVFLTTEDRRRTRWRKTLYTLFTLALAGGAFYAGSRFAPTESDRPPSGKIPVAARPIASAWTDPLLAQLDEALANDRSGDLDGAGRSAEVLSNQAAVPPGLDLYRASLATRTAHVNDAEADLTRLLNASTAPLNTAAIAERMGFNYSRNRDFQKASEYFGQAARLNPFSAPLFYRWGEALRHLGHLDEAVAKFRQTLLRIPTGQPEMASLRVCTEFKLRLALIEAGNEAEVQPALDEQLKAPAPSGYALLAAAAVALQQKNLAGAASLLGRAREALGGETFDALLNDYFFRAFTDRKELAEFFPADPAARREKLMPTMVYSIDP